MDIESYDSINDGFPSRTEKRFITYWEHKNNKDSPIGQDYFANMLAAITNIFGLGKCITISNHKSEKSNANIETVMSKHECVIII